MSGTKEVMQEYLVKLGYAVDQTSFKKMFEGLETTSAKVMKVGAVTGAAVVAVETAVAEFAYSMRKMYFQAELSGTSVKKLNAMAFAGRQIGISNEAMGSSIHSMAQALRLNPGYTAFLQGLGVKVEGRDVSDVMIDFVDASKSMPENVGVKWAAMFGMDPDTYHQMRSHSAELKADMQANLDLYSRYGIDIGAQKSTLLDYTKGLDTLEQHLKIMGMTLLTSLAPQFKALNAMLLDAIDWWAKYWSATEKQKTATVDSLIPTVGDLKRAIGPVDSLIPTVGDLERAIGPLGNYIFIPTVGDLKQAIGLPGNKPLNTPVPSQPPKPLAAPVPSQSPEDLAQRMQDKYGIPASVILGQYKLESDSGKKMPVGSNNPFGIKARKNEAYVESMTTENIHGKDIRIAQRFKKFDSIEEAFEAHSKLLATGRAYAEARKHLDDPLAFADALQGHYATDTHYADKLKGVMGVKLGTDNAQGPTAVVQNNNTTINVTGVDAKTTANNVVSQQSRVYGNATRDLMGAQI